MFFFHYVSWDIAIGIILRQKLVFPIRLTVCRIYGQFAEGRSTSGVLARVVVTRNNDISLLSEAASTSFFVSGFGPLSWTGISAGFTISDLYQSYIWKNLSSFFHSPFRCHLISMKHQALKWPLLCLQNCEPMKYLPTPVDFLIDSFYQEFTQVFAFLNFGCFSIYFIFGMMSSLSFVFISF